MSHEPDIVWQFAPIRPVQQAGADRHRAAFLTGRAVAKDMVLKLEKRATNGSTAVDIISRNHLGRGIRPQLSIDGYPVPWSLSISHTDTAALVAVCTTEGVSVGVDLVPAEPLGPGFSRAWLDEDERRLAGGDPLEVCRLWAVKEAAYKAVNRGDPFAPRRVQIRKQPGGDFTCIYRGIDLTERCHIRTWQCADHLAAMAVMK